ncbi:MAG: WbqC family protein, partial [Salinibacter sp.]
WEVLSDCVCRSVGLQMELMGLDTPVTRATALDGRPARLDAILEATGADALAQPVDQAPSDACPVPVEPVHYEHPTYRQNFEGFEPGMTALDLLFNYGREAPRRMMRGLSTSEAA